MCKFTAFSRNKEALKEKKTIKKANYSFFVLIF